MMKISREKEVVTAETERHLVESDPQFPHHFSPRTLEGGELDAQHRRNLEPIANIGSETHLTSSSE